MVAVEVQAARLMAALSGLNGHAGQPNGMPQACQVAARRMGLKQFTAFRDELSDISLGFAEPGSVSHDANASTHDRPQALE